MQLGISRRSTIASALLVAVAALVYLSVPQVRTAVGTVAAILTTPDVQAAIEAFRDYLLGFGPWAAVVSIALMIFQSVAAPLPAFVITFTNGLLFGWLWGAVISWTGAMLGAALCFWIARSLGRPVVERLVGGSKALEVSDLFFARYGDRTVLIARLLPFVSFDIISYGAGLTPIAFRNFLVATGIGQLPATLLYSYLGQNLTGSVRVLSWVFSITIVIAIIGWTVGPHFVRHLRKTGAEPANAAAAPNETEATQ